MQRAGYPGAAVDQRVGIAAVAAGFHLQVRALYPAGLAAQLAMKRGAQIVADDIVFGRSATYG